MGGFYNAYQSPLAVRVSSVTRAFVFDAGVETGLELSMFGSIGMPELLVIFIIALIIFGPRRLPELGKSLGKSINEFKKASNDLRNSLEEEIRLEEHKTQAAAASANRPVAAEVEPVAHPIDSKA